MGWRLVGGCLDGDGIGCMGDRALPTATQKIWTCRFFGAGHVYVYRTGRQARTPGVTGGFECDRCGSELLPCEVRGSRSGERIRLTVWTGGGAEEYVMVGPKIGKDFGRFHPLRGWFLWAWFAQRIREWR